MQKKILPFNLRWVMLKLKGFVCNNCTLSLKYNDRNVRIIILLNVFMKIKCKLILTLWVFLGPYFFLCGCICPNKLGWFSCFSAPAGDPWFVILLENQTVMSHSLLNIDLKHQLLFNFSSLALAWHLPWLISPGVIGRHPLVTVSAVVCLTLKHRESNRAQILLAIVLHSFLSLCLSYSFSFRFQFSECFIGILASMQVLIGSWNVGVHIRMAPDLNMCKMMLTVNSFGYY